MYYVLTSQQFEDWADQISHNPAWTLDRSMCIVHNDNGLDIVNYHIYFETPEEVNEWRFNPDTEEWRNWETEDEHYGL